MIQARSFVFEGLNFDDHHMALDGFVVTSIGDGFPKGGDCIDVDDVEATLKADGASCVAVDGVATSISVADPSACVDTDGETGLST